LEGLPDPGTGGFVPPTIPGHSPGIGLPYDPAQARQLMEQAGYPDGQGLITDEIVWQEPFKNVHEYMQSQWMGNLNVEVTVKITDWENIIGTYQSSNIFIMGWGADYPDPDSFLRVGVRAHLPRWCNDKYNQLLEEAQRALDQPERMRLYQEADKILIEEAVVIPIIYANFPFLVKPWVKLPFSRLEESDFKDVIIEPH
jgi:oligopeptide transport system substrate-binding protein